MHDSGRAAGRRLCASANGPRQTPTFSAARTMGFEHRIRNSACVSQEVRQPDLERSVSRTRSAARSTVALDARERSRSIERSCRWILSARFPSGEESVRKCRLRLKPRSSRSRHTTRSTKSSTTRRLAPRRRARPAAPLWRTTSGAIRNHPGTRPPPRGSPRPGQATRAGRTLGATSVARPRITGCGGSDPGLRFPGSTRPRVPPAGCDQFSSACARR